MITLTQRLESSSKIQATLTLPFELRQKSRIRTTLDNGDEVGLILNRGHTLRNGNYIASEDGAYVVEVRAAEESVSTATSDNTLQLMRACYHLGNRHMPLQVTADWIRYQKDHVLDDMVSSLGLTITHSDAPFEPEDGAYHSHSHSHDE